MKTKTSKTKTSKTSPIGINKITVPHGRRGWVAVTLAPGKKTVSSRGFYWDRDLAADLDRLKKLGATTLVCFLDDHELMSLDIERLPEEAEKRGLDFIRFPFHDGGVPAYMRGTLDLVEEICTLYQKGERIVMHCNGGLGRAGTIAACVRLALGLDEKPAEAIMSVRRLRSRSAIESAEQERFVARFFDEWKTRLGMLYKQADLPEVDARRRGAWYGLAVGDALGAPAEFMDAGQIKKRFGVLDRMHAGGPWKAGEWTDDTALAICIAHAYGNRGRSFDLAASVGKMLEWYRSGPKDIGNQTAQALSLAARGTAPHRLAGKMLELRPGGAGNGSLMRAAATGLVRHFQDPRRFEESIAASAVTHPDPRCTAACAALNAALSVLVFFGPNVEWALREAEEAARGIEPEVAQLVRNVRGGGKPEYADKPIGYVLLCLERALIALRDARSFERGLVDVVGQGGDTDTNACVAGALLGARFGIEEIPGRWLDALLRRRELDRAYARLQRVAKGPRGARLIETQDVGGDFLFCLWGPDEEGVYTLVYDPPACGDYDDYWWGHMVNVERVEMHRVRYPDGKVRTRDVIVTGCGLFLPAGNK